MSISGSYSIFALYPSTVITFMASLRAARAASSPTPPRPCPSSARDGGGGRTGSSMPRGRGLGRAGSGRRPEERQAGRRDLFDVAMVRPATATHDVEVRQPPLQVDVLLREFDRIARIPLEGHLSRRPHHFAFDPASLDSVRPAAVQRSPQAAAAADSSRRSSGTVRAAAVSLRSLLWVSLTPAPGRPPPNPARTPRWNRDAAGEVH
jgi:hypothetical protein